MKHLTLTITLTLISYAGFAQYEFPTMQSLYRILDKETPIDFQNYLINKEYVMQSTEEKKPGEHVYLFTKIGKSVNERFEVLCKDDKTVSVKYVSTIATKTNKLVSEAINSYQFKLTDKFGSKWGISSTYETSKKILICDESEEDSEFTVFLGEM